MLVMVKEVLRLVMNIGLQMLAAALSAIRDAAPCLLFGYKKPTCPRMAQHEVERLGNAHGGILPHECFHFLVNFVPHLLANGRCHGDALAGKELAHHCVGALIAHAIARGAIAQSPVERRLVRVRHTVFDHKMECFVVD